MSRPDRLQELALRAALSPPAEALSAWSGLLDEVDWLDLPDRIHRCLPSIAVTLSCQASPGGGASATCGPVPHAARLAGVYRSTWADNILRLRAVGPLLDALSARDVDHRVLKGAAVCALADRWGVRRMGDIDVAVHVDDASSATAVLRDHGYTPRFFRRIDDARPPHASCWQGPRGDLVDLHLADPGRGGNRLWHRPGIIDLMLGQPPMAVRSQERSWPLPGREEMIVHAVAHARVAAANSDHAQAVLDIARMLPACDLDRLSRLARDVGLAAPVRAMCAEVWLLAGRPDHEVRSVARSSRRRVIPGPAPAVVDVLQAVRDAATVISERRPGDRDLAVVRSRPRVHRRVYPLWLRAGQLRPVERLASAVMGGFIPPGGSSADLLRDRRRRVVIPGALRGEPITVEIACADPYARLLFIDGRSHGVIDGTAIVRLERAPAAIEVSLRLLGDPTSVEITPREDQPVRVQVSSRPGGSITDGEGLWI